METHLSQGVAETCPLSLVLPSDVRSGELEIAGGECMASGPHYCDFVLLHGYTSKAQERGLMEVRATKPGNRHLVLSFISRGFLPTLDLCCKNKKGVRPKNVFIRWA